jgi:hypothetical protein
MNEDKTEELRRIHAAWSEERLVRAAFVDADEYSPQAVVIMRQTLEARGVSSDDIASMLAAVQPDDIGGPNLNAVRGWLLVFVIWSGIVSAVGFVSSLVLVIGGEGYARAIGVAGLAVSVYGGYCSYVMAAADSGAPSHARRWLIGLALYGVATMTVALLAEPELSSGAGRPLIFALIWLPYLSYSKRVAAVYRRQTSRNI